MNAPADKQLTIETEQDIVIVRKVIRGVCQNVGFGLTDVTRVVTAASELARNIYRYANKGVLTWKELSEGSKKGLEMIFQDEGPGIPDIEQVMQEGYSSSRSMGMGLPGTKRLMDEMRVESVVGEGTKITIRKWTR